MRVLIVVLAVMALSTVTGIMSVAVSKGVISLDTVIILGGYAWFAVGAMVFLFWVDYTQERKQQWY